MAVMQPSARASWCRYVAILVQPSRCGVGVAVTCVTRLHAKYSTILGHTPLHAEPSKSAGQVTQSADSTSLCEWACA